MYQKNIIFLDCFASDFNFSINFNEIKTLKQNTAGIVYARKPIANSKDKILFL